MSNEQKLREALQALLASGGEIAEATDDELQAAIDDPDAEEIVKVQAAAVLNARQALATTEQAAVLTEVADLGVVPKIIKPFTPTQRKRLWDNSKEHHKDAASFAGFERIVTLTERAHQIGTVFTTTEPEPTGMPEVKPWDHPEPQTMRWSDLEIRWIQSYGKRCWNAGFRHGDFSDENISYLAQIRDAVAEICPGASEDLLMNAIGGPCEVPRYVIDVVQKLKQDAARYRWLRDDTDSDWAICEWSHAPGDEGYYRDARAPHIVDAAIDAAMAQGVK